MKNPLQSDSRHNPLVIPILRVLQGAGDQISEHDLICSLRESGNITSGPGEMDHLALFQTHFLVMNALYQLQQSSWQNGFYLLISPLKIQLLVNRERSDTDLLDNQPDHALRDYYLDFRNLRDTDAEQVSQLLFGFWRRFSAADQQQEAYRVLGLEPNADWTQVQLTYRRRAAELHPDRGGDAVQFMAVREAYETLRNSKS